MDYSSQSIYQNQRSSVTEGLHNGHAPGSFPNNIGQLGVHTQGMAGNQILANHANYSHNGFQTNVSEHYNQLPLRKEVDEEGRICSVATNVPPDPIPTEEAKNRHEEGIETKIKSEAEEDEAFVSAAHETLLQVNNNEITLEEAADVLQRPISYVDRRYQEFCENITRKEPEKKRRVSRRPHSKKKRKSKRVKVVKRRRILSGEIYQCEICPATFNRESQLKMHTKVHSAENESHPCTACGVVFPKMTKLMRHRMTVHKDALQCPHCNAQFGNIPAYSYHIKTHTRGERQYKCDECGKEFYQKSSLIKHEFIHTGERPYMCGYCEKTFVTLSNLKSHYQIHTGGPPKPFECEECGKRFTAKSSLDEHINIHLKEKPYECDECDAKFNFKQNLNRHKLIHSGEIIEKSFKCDYCPAAFTLSTDLRRHTTVHTGNKPFKCDMCDFSCTRKTSFEYHQNIHTGKKPFKCDVYGCTMAYSRPQSLQIHKLKHGPPPPVSCTECNENFPDRTAMKRHMMIHTGEKPYACDQCEQICYDQADLKRHMFKHMYKPIKNKPKQIKPKKRYAHSTNPVIAETASNKWTTNGYQVPEVATDIQNVRQQHSAAAVSHYGWNTHTEDTNSQPAVQPTFNSFTSSQYTNSASSLMEYRTPSIYENQRSSITEPAPGLIPINNTNSQISAHTSGVTGRPETHMLDNQTNHTNYSQNTNSNNMSEHHYNQLPLRKDVAEEEGICSEASNTIPDPPPTEESNDALDEGLETKIKSETEEDEAFLVFAQDAFLQVKSKEITLHQAAIRLERPYSYVNKRYREFLDNMDEIESEAESVIIKAKKRKKRKTKRLKVVKNRPKKGGKIYQCDKCPATFYRDYQFKVHAKVHVAGNESHPCTECGVVFPKMQKLMLHRMTIHEEALQCPHCNSQFTHIRNYKYHMKVHAEGKPFKCEDCGQRFIQKTSLKIHKRIHTGERPYMCGYCDKTFITISSLKQHHHSHTGTRAKPHECEECGKRYPSNSSLIEHMNIHKGERPLACDECDARFNFKQQLKRHKEVVHLGYIVEKPFKCKYCPGEFALSADLRRHTTVHTGDKPFKCNMCDFACTRKTSFEYHQYTHTGEKPFKCDFYGCTMEYNRPQSLKMHKLKHEPPPPVVCKVCHEKFPDRVALKRHMIVHGEKVLVCDQCEQICYDQSALKRHMFKHMSKPFDSKSKQSRPKKRHIQPKKPVTVEPTIKKWPTNGYQVPEIPTTIVQNSHVQHSVAAPSHYAWNTHTEDTHSQPPVHSQPPFNPFTASQYTNLVNNAWPTAIDPDELRMRLLSSFK